MDSKTLKRFLAKVNKEPGQGPNGDCWEWTGAKTGNKYGAIKIGKSMFSVHRLSYEHFRGPIPEGLFVLHHCDNQPCANPAHLFVGTHDDNMKDMVEKNRQAKPVGIPRPKTRGEKNGNAKLAPEQVREIRASHGQKSQRALACEYGISQRLVGNIIHRKTWTHI